MIATVSSKEGTPLPLSMMLTKLDTFVLLTNKGPNMDKRDEHWSKIKHGDDGMRKGKKNRVSSDDFRALSHHSEYMKAWAKYTRCYFINFVQRLL